MIVHKTNKGGSYCMQRQVAGIDSVGLGGPTSRAGPALMSFAGGLSTPRSRMAGLKDELAAARIELQSAIRDLEQSNREGRIANDEVRLVNEELQITNEELLTPRDELQLSSGVLAPWDTQLQDEVSERRISPDSLLSTRKQDCMISNRSAEIDDLRDSGQKWPPHESISTQSARQDTAAPVIFVVEDDDRIRAALRDVLEAEGLEVQAFGTCEAFLDAHQPGHCGCLLIDAYLPGMGGLELLQQLYDAGSLLPVIVITGRGNVAMAVQAMKAGALDFIEKPIGYGDLLASVAHAVNQSRDVNEQCASQEDVTRRIAGLTARQRQVMDLVLAGQPNKIIAADLGLSQRTVENHRAVVMKKTGARSLPALARMISLLTHDRAGVPPHRTGLKPHRPEHLQITRSGPADARSPRPSV